MSLTLDKDLIEASRNLLLEMHISKNPAKGFNTNNFIEGAKKITAQNDEHGKALNGGKPVPTTTYSVENGKVTKKLQQAIKLEHKEYGKGVVLEADYDPATNSFDYTALFEYIHIVNSADPDLSVLKGDEVEFVCEQMVHTDKDAAHDAKNASSWNSYPFASPDIKHIAVKGGEVHSSRQYKAKVNGYGNYHSTEEALSHLKAKYPNHTNITRSEKEMPDEQTGEKLKFTHITMKQGLPDHTSEGSKKVYIKMIGINGQYAHHNEVTVSKANNAATTTEEVVSKELDYTKLTPEALLEAIEEGKLLVEGRGRPSLPRDANGKKIRDPEKVAAHKAALKAAGKAANASLEHDDEESEADQHIVNHLHKAIDSGGTHAVKFANGEKVKVPVVHARKALQKHLDTPKPADRLKLQEKMGSSHAEFLDSIK